MWEKNDDLLYVCAWSWEKVLASERGYTPQNGANHKQMAVLGERNGIPVKPGPPHSRAAAYSKRQV